MPAADDDREPLWEHIVFPALRDPVTGAPSTAPDAVALWPAKWSRIKLLRKRANLTAALFASTHQQDPQRGRQYLGALNRLLGGKQARVDRYVEDMRLYLAGTPLRDLY